MKRKLNFFLAIVLAITMVVGMSLTSFSATVAMKNPSSTGVQLIGDTLVIQEDHHNFFVWGKSVMIQCPGVTDILPNNVTDMMDIQFNGNLYKGIREVLIVSTPGKDDKVRLEEGSMIVTGVTTPEQVQNIKATIASRPNTLAELKTMLTGASQEFSTTKNYIVGKHNAVQNENGNRVSKKEFQGTVELVADEEVVQAVVEEAKASASENNPAEEKKAPTPSPTPTPTPTCSVDHSQHCAGWTCEECHQPGTKEHAWFGGVCKECQTPCSHHRWTDAVCDNCGMTCPVCGGEGDSEDGCENCGYFPDGPCGIADTHYLVHEGQQCDACPYVGEAPHTWEPAGPNNHKCSSCIDVYEAHAWEDGVCTICHYTCEHPGEQEDTCSYCGKSLASPTPCSVNHSAYCMHWTCECGEKGTGSHDWQDSNGRCSYCNRLRCQTVDPMYHNWDDGRCTYCGNTCNWCNGEGAEGGCGKCGKVASTTPTHNCDTDGHDWDSSTGICNYCDAPCPTCNGQGISDGCPVCGKSLVVCQVNHSQYCIHWTCECGEKGTGSHDWQDNGICSYCNLPRCRIEDPSFHRWTDAVCDVCGMTCDWCNGEGAEGGCGKCGKES